jgi:hypothetical protein
MACSMSASISTDIFNTYARSYQSVPSGASLTSRSEQ